MNLVDRAGVAAKNSHVSLTNITDNCGQPLGAPLKENDRAGGLTYNHALDDEQNYSNIDLIRFVPENHLLVRFSRQIAAATFLPVSTVFLMGLGVYSSMAARRYCLLYQDRKRLPMGLYVVAEQPPGTGKTRCLDSFQSPFIAAHLKAVRDIQKQIKPYEARISAKESLVGEENERYADLKEKAARLSCSPFVSNATPEGLEKMLVSTLGCFAAVSSEQGLFNSLLGASYRAGEPSSNNNDVMLNGFDGGNVSSLRVSRQGYQGPVVGGVACFAQAGSIEKVFSASNGTGLCERFLLLVEPHFLGRRDHGNAGQIAPDVTAEYKIACSFIEDVLDEPVELGEMLTLHISDDGHRLINEYRNKIEPWLVDGGKLSHVTLRGAASKINMQVMKIAAVLSVMDSNNLTQVPNKYIQAAIDIANELLEANLALSRSKGIMGVRAEFSAILSLFEKDQRGRSERNIIQANIKKKPFSESSGNKSELVRKALAEMVDQQLLSTVDTDGKTTYYQAQ